MDRHDCEKIILEKLKDIVAIYHEYNPEGDYLYLSYNKTEDAEDSLSFNNAYYDKDEEKPIRVYFGVSWDA